MSEIATGVVNFDPGSTLRGVRGVKVEADPVSPSSIQSRDAALLE